MTRADQKPARAIKRVLTMNATQIQLVQDSFAQLIPSGETSLETFFGEIFYQRLFELQPHLRQLFQGDMVKQSQKLLDMLRSIINNLERPDVPSIQELGSKHKTDYKVKNTDYNAVGEALIWTFEATMGEDFTPELRQAWVTAYGLLAQTMKPTEV